MAITSRIVTEAEWKQNIKYQGDGYIVYQSPTRCPENDPPTPEGWQVAWAGGGWPYVVVYDPAKIDVMWLSAGRIYSGEFVYSECIEVSLPASVHGCYKLKTHQRLLVINKRRCTMLNIIKDQLVNEEKVLVDVALPAQEAEDFVKQILSFYGHEYIGGGKTSYPLKDGVSVRVNTRFQLTEEEKKFYGDTGLVRVTVNAKHIKIDDDGFYKVQITANPVFVINTNKEVSNA